MYSIQSVNMSLYDVLGVSGGNGHEEGTDRRSTEGHTNDAEQTQWQVSQSAVTNMLNAVRRLQSEPHSLCFLFQNDRRGKRKCPGAAEGAQPGLQWTL